MQLTVERAAWRLPDVTAMRAALPITLILAIGAVARTWQLAQNEFGRQYYAAAVRGMMESWHSVFFNSFDPAGFVSLDKPPVAIWLQAVFAKLLGFSGHSILLAQVVAGLVAILLLYLIVQRTLGRTAAIWAALALAVTPVSIAVDRSNNTESCLILVLLAATWLAMRAAETGRLSVYCGAMAALGVGFNVKMGAALVLAPVFALAFSLAWRSAPLAWHVGRQAIAGVVLIVVSLAWVTAFDLTPASERPYAGSTRHNSMLELALKHNGTARFLKPAAKEPSPAPAASPEDTQASDPVAVLNPVLYDDSPTGLFRLFRPRAATQVAWLLPVALAGLALAWLVPAGCGSIAQCQIGAGIWTGWLAFYWLVLSFAGGPVHTYYIAVLAPPLAVFFGIAVAELWSRWQAGTLARWIVPALVLLTIAWQSHLFFWQDGAIRDGWLRGAWLASIAAALAGAGLLALSRPRTTYVRGAVATGLAALLVLPSLTAASVVLVRPNVAAPIADMAALLNPPDWHRETLRRARQDAARTKLINFLTANRGSATYLLAVPNANVAAPLILATGQPVMAMGGYLGDDPILTPGSLERLVADGKLRYVMIGGFTLAPGSTALAPIEAWVRAHGRLVDPLVWGIYRARKGAPYNIPLGGRWVAVPAPELYDLAAR
jgi:4-amino-4-deoxy-L-arabinose transferase-like glycosyltransferase